MPDSFATPWTAAQQALLSMGFPGQEYWSGVPFLSPGDIPDPGIEPREGEGILLYTGCDLWKNLVLN